MPRAEIYYLHLLPSGALPRRSQPLDFEQVEQHRHLDCPAYSRCLHFVARSPWPGFSCHGCARFSPPPGRRAVTSADKPTSPA